MFHKAALAQGVGAVGKILRENREYLMGLSGDVQQRTTDAFRMVTNYLSTAEDSDLGNLLAKTAHVFRETANSAAGEPVAAAFLKLSVLLRGREEVPLPELAQAMRVAAEQMVEQDRCRLGEKTFFDALFPAVVALEEAGDSAQAWKKAAEAAEKGAQATSEQVIIGHALTGERSITWPDAGAVTVKLIFQALAECWGEDVHP